ncbi:hypothetical protein DAEQUDRAFT_814802 [Daedalea quercina L-15889]|uniref:F-box domain-containing protein n=1 Tax=Daedalea quercina L-15889 TaxID=1314783 RepID=A0A165LR51_9APHY|nr:hypothetical protein DAEQUDRAFT_814802 [Daedalea quercina L-15889]
MSSVSLLPSEVWQEVFAWLHQDAARTCLSVSKEFHDLASRVVFRKLTVYFGSWESTEASDDVYEAEQEALDALEDRMSSLSSAILHRISHDPTFATIVQSLDVRAYKRDGTRGAFERGSLIEAICHLHNLRTFTWHGVVPIPTPDIVEALASSCPMLRHFSAPLLTLSRLPLYKLETLWSIGYTWKWFYDTTRGRRSRLHEQDRDLTICCESLRELQMPYTSPWNIPLDRLPMLTHLDLLSIQDLDGFGPAIRRITQLESLSVFCSRRQHDKLFEALAYLKSDLPNLHSLCLLSRRERALESEHAQILTNILKGRTRMRRFRSTFRLHEAGHMRFLGAISSLRNLEALHWDVFMEDITRDFMHVYLQHLPSGILALSIATSGLFRDADAFADLWSRCPGLRFLYVRTWGSEERLADRILHGAVRLQIVGYNGKFHYVDIKGEQPQLSAPWSAHKVAFRGMRDFGLGCEDAEWLMRGLRIRREWEEEGQ